MFEEIDIEALRGRLDWSQAALAEYLGVSQATVSRLEAGKQKPKGPMRKVLQQLAEEAQGDAA